jgi:hypothetical protein
MVRGAKKAARAKNTLTSIVISLAVKSWRPWAGFATMHGQIEPA